MYGALRWMSDESVGQNVKPMDESRTYIAFYWLLPTVNSLEFTIISHSKNGRMECIHFF